jgi:hypothetical protein
MKPALKEFMLNGLLPFLAVWLALFITGYILKHIIE